MAVTTGKRIGQAIKNFRIDSGVTQTELAKRIGVAQPRVSAVERGADTASLEFIQKVEKALKLKKGAILRASGQVEPDGDGDVNVAEMTVHLQAAVNELSNVAEALGYKLVPADDRLAAKNRR